MEWMKRKLLLPLAALGIPVARDRQGFVNK